MDMMFVLVLCLIGTTQSFLLDSKNNSHTGTFLTVSEYYNDKTRTEQIMDSVRQQLLADKLASQRNLQLLATQIQDQLTAFQQELKSNSVATAQQASITDLEQKYHDLEIKYGEMKNSTVSLQQKYDNLAIKNLNLEQENIKLKQWRDSLNQTSEMLHQKVNSLENENTVLHNITTGLEQKVKDLEQLRGINQLQTLREVLEKTQTLDTKVTALANTEQARSQDFMALYQKLNSLETSEMVLKNQTNERIKELREYNNKTDKRIEGLTAHNNQTNERIEKLTVYHNQTNERIEELRLFHNQSLSMMQDHINKQLQPIVLTACHNAGENINAGGVMRFNEIKTAVGIPDTDISTYRTSGKFKCKVPGYYFVTTTMESPHTQTAISFMLNSESKQNFYLTGEVSNVWTPGTASYTFKLQTNDEVWIQLSGNYKIRKSCFSIFKVL